MQVLSSQLLDVIDSRLTSHHTDTYEEKMKLNIRKYIRPERAPVKHYSFRLFRETMFVRRCSHWKHGDHVFLMRF
jgi:hypothetical protein